MIPPLQMLPAAPSVPGWWLILCPPLIGGMLGESGAGLIIPIYLTEKGIENLRPVWDPAAHRARAIQLGDPLLHMVPAGRA